MGCTIEEATSFANAYAKGFPGIAKFKAKGEIEVKTKGYILLNPITGHKTYWWDWNKWKERGAEYTSEFWDRYKIIKNAYKEAVKIDITTPMPEEVKEVREHFQTASKWARKALNSVTQGTGAIILKDSQIDVFNWVVDNGYFGIILLNNLTHDEANWEYPKEVTEFPTILQSCMEKSAAKYCKSLPIPAEPTVGDHWIH